jgi:hypothetical protein
MLPAMRAPTVRRALQVLLAVLAVAVVWTLVVVVSVGDELSDARSTLSDARDADDVEAVGPRLAEAEADLERATSRLGQPGPALVSRIPLLGRPVRAISRAATAGHEVVRGTQAVLAAAKPEGGSLVVEGGVRLDGLRGVTAALEAAERSSREPVEDLLDQPTGWLPGPIGDPVRDAQEELAGIPAAFGRAAASTKALTGVLGGDEPRQVLLVLENNAELRGTGGIVTVFAEAVSDRGRVDVGPFRDVEDVAADRDEAVRVDSPEDYHRLWGRYLADSTLWKNANMTPDAPTASVVLSNVVDKTIGRRPTVVLWLDVRAIEKVLDATGPATLPDGNRLTSSNAVRKLLSDAYRSAPDTRAGQAKRRAQLRAVADAVLERILGGSASPTELGLALSEAAAGRHLKLWSADPEEQAGLVEGGLAGEVAAGAGGDLSSFVVQNFGGGGGEGNKLDYYSRRQVTTTVDVGLDTASVRHEVSLRNTAPRTGLPRYVAGFETPGVLNSLVSLAVPRDARLLEFTREGRAVRTEVLPEGDHSVVSDVTELPPGTTATWVLRYEVPLEDGRYRLSALPQPLAVDGGLSLTVRALPGLRLSGAEPGDVVDGRVSYSGPFERRMDVDVTAERHGLVRRTVDLVRRFWDEPVS